MLTGGIVAACAHRPAFVQKAHGASAKTRKKKERERARESDSASASEEMDAIPFGIIWALLFAA
jgi:hypothetical protein